MKQAMVDYTKGPKFDHFNAPDYAVKPLLKYINLNWTVMVLLWTSAQAAYIYEIGEGVKHEML
jgi:hypothetical protein